MTSTVLDLKANAKDSSTRFKVGISKVEGDFHWLQLSDSKSIRISESPWESVDKDTLVCIVTIAFENLPKSIVQWFEEVSMKNESLIPPFLSITCISPPTGTWRLQFSSRPTTNLVITQGSYILIMYCSLILRS